MKEKILSVLGLFTTASTLICCALPALLVAFGLGAVVISAVSAFPWLIPLTRNKEWLFLGAGVLIGLNFFLVYPRRKQLACDIQGRGDGCQVGRNWNNAVLWLSAGIYTIGLFMAYLALPLLRMVG